MTPGTIELTPFVIAQYNLTFKSKLDLFEKQPATCLGLLYVTIISVLVGYTNQAAFEVVQTIGRCHCHFVRLFLSPPVLFSLCTHHFFAPLPEFQLTFPPTGIMLAAFQPCQVFLPLFFTLPLKSAP